MRLVSRRNILTLGALAVIVSGCGGGRAAIPLPPASGTFADGSLGRSAARSLPDAALPQGYGRNAVVAWNNVALQAIRDTHPAPPVVARALAIVNTCIYDAWAAYDRRALGTQYADRLRRPRSERTHANEQRAVSFAAFRALTDLFPQSAQSALFVRLMQALGYDANDVSLDTATPSGIGNAACAKVLAYRHHDGSNQLGDLGGSGPYADYTGFVASNTPTSIVDPNAWQPLFVPATGVTQQYATPFWGRVVPFSIASPAQYLPAVGPARYTRGGSAAANRDYIDQANEILAYSANLSDRQKVIAEYWADGPGSEAPPGHWNLFGQYVSQRDHHSLGADAKMLFALSNAIFDASIAVWGVKRTYVSERPITAIHFLYAHAPVTAWAGPGKGTQTFDGALWNPYQPATVITPAFPEYVSGHSAFSAAGAQILANFSGADRFDASFTNLPGISRVEPGLTPRAAVTLSWPTFSAAAEEAGISRRYGGIHFKDGDLQGRLMGRTIGNVAWRKALEFYNGSDDDGVGDDD